MAQSTSFREAGFLFKKKFGQNFLNDVNLLSAIAEDAGVDRDTTVLEIGAGAGALTRILSERAKRVVSYEIDRTLEPFLNASLSGYENVEIEYCDFMKERLCDVERNLGPYLVVANLPYYLTTPLIMRFVEEGKNCLGLTLMVQEEVAERICAKEGTKEYGALTAAIGRRGSAKIKRRVSRNLFTPRPNVDSAVVEIDFQRGGFLVKSEELYQKVLRCAFGNRRKTLENNLKNFFHWKREEAEKIMRSIGIETEIRGEALSPRQLGLLSDAIFDFMKEMLSGGKNEEIDDL